MIFFNQQKSLSLLLFICVLFAESNQDEDFQQFLSHLIKQTDRKFIENSLRYLTKKPHVGGTEAEHETADYVAKTWKEQGLDTVKVVPYEVMLSYPEKQNPNYARIIDEKNCEVWKSQGRSKPLFAKEEWSKEVFPDFNAFSPPGNATGDIVYANYGSEKDFIRLESLGKNISGCVVIAKYGKVFRGNIVQSAEKRGAVGVLLYPDPQQYAPNGSHAVYPDTIFMPGSTAPFGTVYMNDGDPQTPFYPSIKSAFRIPENETAVPGIPVMPLPYADAKEILRNMAGPTAPSDWQGGLNITYRLGPGMQKAGHRISMEVNTRNKKALTYNVIGMIKGTEEPDRYVILGNHRDAWIFGAIDPSSATAVMLELTRLFTSHMKTTEWRPRRTLVFCSWGSEEFGLIGSTEWAEQFGKQLSDRSVAYLNLDMAIEGNYTVRAKSSPLLYEIAKNVAKWIPNPDPEEEANGRTSVFDTWLFRNPDDEKPGEPRFTGLGTGSDYKSFQHYLGIPCLEYRYTHSKELMAEPLYHTLYETFHSVSKLYDEGFHFHASVTQLWGLTSFSLATEAILSYSLGEYATFIDDAQQSLSRKYSAVIEARNISLEYFEEAAELFRNATITFEDDLRNLDLNNSLAVRRLNDQLMMVERSFIDPKGLPGRPFYNHVVFAPSSTDNYAATAFAGLSDALAGIEELPEREAKARWRQFQEHLATCTHLLLTAGKVLSDDLW